MEEKIAFESREHFNEDFYVWIYDGSDGVTIESEYCEGIFECIDDAITQLGDKLMDENIRYFEEGKPAPFLQKFIQDTIRHRAESKKS